MQGPTAFQRILGVVLVISFLMTVGSSERTNMAWACNAPPFWVHSPLKIQTNPLKFLRIEANPSNIKKKNHQILAQKRCLRCNSLYEDKDNSPTACLFHGHTNGERGLFALAPPHQGIDGEWSEGSGVIVYKWNDKDNRPNTGRPNWKKRWSCCGEYEERASPCRRGWHVSYDDGFTLF